jgi:hypothetical protein
MSLLNKITVDQFQRIVSIEANSIYTTSDKKIGVVAVIDNVPIEQVKKMTIAEVNKRYAEINAASKSLSTLAAKQYAKVAGKWYRFEWFIDEISAGQLVELYSYDMTSEHGVIDNLHLILATLSRECRVWKWWPKAYDGKGHKQRAEAMLQMNMGDVWGYAAFFLQLSEPLLTIMRKSLTEQERKMTTAKA